MKTLSKRVIILVVSSVVVVGTIAAYAHNRMHNAEHRAEWIVASVSDELELDVTQIAKLNVLKDELLAIRNNMHEQHQDTHSQILSLLEEPQLNRQKTLNMIENKTQMVNQHAPAVVNALGDFYDSLNPEQHEELREHITHMAKHRGHYGKHYMGRHDDEDHYEHDED